MTAESEANYQDHFKEAMIQKVHDNENHPKGLGRNISHLVMTKNHSFATFHPADLLHLVKEILLDKLSNHDLARNRSPEVGVSKHTTVTENSAVKS